MFKEYSKDRQIIINTHSPYFVDMDSLVNGACLYRTIKNNAGNIDVFPLSDQSKKNIGGFLKKSVIYLKCFYDFMSILTRDPD